jgi:hypothetical protein
MNANLHAYLNDHLAGSVAAVEMLERAIAQNEGTELAGTLAGILNEIRADQEVLRTLIGRVGGSENPLKKAGAWLAEKAGRLKLHDLAEGPLDRLEMLEALALGIHGKLSLWRSIQHAVARHPAVAGLDLDDLIRRAESQRARVETLRLAAAAAAF